MWEGQLEATNLTPHLVLHDKNTIVNAVTASGVFAAASILIKSLFPQLSLEERWWLFAPHAAENRYRLAPVW